MSVLPMRFFGSAVMPAVSALALGLVRAAVGLTAFMVTLGSVLWVTPAWAQLAGEGLLAPAVSATPAALPRPDRVQVLEPFIEMRTGPGRGYPVFHVVERAAWIVIELRRTDWYRVRVDGVQNAAVGWVQREQLEATLTDAGAGRNFRDAVVDDYLNRRLEFGAALGRVKGQPLVKFWGAYRLGESIALQAVAGQMQGPLAGTDYWHLGLIAEPWSDRRWSPFLTVGLGRFNNQPGGSLISPSVTRAKLGHAGVGLNWHVSERLVARLDWGLNAAFVSDTRVLEFRTLSAGMAFYF
jgi:hypothetical protein